MPTTLFDRFLQNMSEEGVSIDRDSSATAALINSSMDNVKEAGRQTHKQCTHTNFKECKKINDENLDNELLETLAANRDASRPRKS